MQNIGYIGKIAAVLLLCVAMLASLCSCGMAESFLGLGGDESSVDSDLSYSWGESKEEDISVEIPDTNGALFETEAFGEGLAITAYTGTDGLVKIPSTINGSTVLCIKDGAFADIEEGEDARVISEVLVPSTVTEINNKAFSGCAEIKALDLPFAGGAADKHAYIGYIFGAVNPQGNEKALPETLQSVTVGGKAIADNAFLGCENIKSIVVTEAESIGVSAFEGCTALKTLLLPDSAATIGKNAIKNCNSINTLSLPYFGNGSDKLFLGAFFGAEDYTQNLQYVPSSLRTLTVPCPEELPEGAFYECNNIVTLNLKGNLKTVGEKAFYRCRRLKNLNIEYEGYTGISSIEEYAFGYCAAIGEIQLAADVNQLPDGVFYACSSLRTLRIGELENTLPSTHSDIGEAAFAYCESLPTLVLPDGISQIKDKAFYGCADLKEISLPKSVESIGNNAFMGCTALKTVDIGSVQAIGDGAFSYCSSLTELVLPQSVTSIGKNAFAYSSLKALRVEGKNVSVGENAFEGCSELLVEVDKQSQSYTSLVEAGLGNSNFAD